jgi:hypothetical protein
MRSKLGRFGSAVALSLLVAACTDTSQPAAPDLGGPLAPSYAQAQLAAWFAEASPAALEMEGAVFADHDEAARRIAIGVEDVNAILRIQPELARRGIPEDAVEFRITPPIYQVATLRDRWRPTIGGIQIHFGQYLCTMGFNADDGTERSFITNSHCTNTQGGVEGTQYYQPTSTVDPTVIATEVEDPTYFRGGACPRGRKCRYSDASRARYSADVASTRGAVAATSGPNNGSLEVTGTWTITSQDNTTQSFASGTTVNKVGRTTGWTQGNTTSSCVNVNVSGSNITQLCQTLVQDPNGAVLVGGGDSGSQIFRVTSGSNVQLVGILWGGSSDGKLFVFSPLKNIQQELGSLVATN